MQPHETYRNTFNELIDRAVETADETLPAGGYTVDDSTELRSRPQAVRTAATTWKRAKRDLARIHEAIDEFSSEAARISDSTHLTPEAQQARLTIVAARLDDSVTESSSATKEKIDQVLETLRAAALPRRDGTNEVAEEARLVGVKGDLRMVLDSVSDPALIVDRMAHQLERALGDGDSLTAWLLATSRWPEDYISSRGGDSADQQSLRAGLDAVLDHHSTGEARTVRDAYRAVANPQAGLAMLSTVLSAMLPQLLRSLASAHSPSFSSAVATSTPHII